ncbi:MAG: 2'-5' RNA ligase family protein [Propionibacteriales bacterium]|nr:2'-5' RNA ligase family protein [Propionibacteriales bacterium]
MSSPSAVPEPASPHAVEGRTALIIPLDGLGAQVETWRLRADPIAPDIPPHVTVLFPFLPLDLLDDAVRDRLRSLFASVSAREVRLTAVGTFPSVVWLKPEPGAWLVELTGRVWAQWPDHPPYEGAHDEIIPHLTVAHGADHADAVLADLTPVLPIVARAEAVHLFAFHDGSWTDRARFPFSG